MFSKRLKQEEVFVPTKKTSGKGEVTENLLKSSFILNNGNIHKRFQTES